MAKRKRSVFCPKKAKACFLGGARLVDGQIGTDGILSTMVTNLECSQTLKCYTKRRAIKQLHRMTPETKAQVTIHPESGTHGCIGCLGDVDGQKECQCLGTLRCDKRPFALKHETKPCVHAKSIHYMPRRNVFHTTLRFRKQALVCRGWG